ncbi:MAG: CPBP family intramembrane metalloprotease [Cyanobacteria bacterium SZAS LIN-2]|nr:CPBP family intramembrane metalloprotease [Cyanobacteria bacterium SZAS LIN-2]
MAEKGSPGFSRHKWVVVVWTFLPWMVLSIGLHFFHSIVGTFFLYHACCLLPIIIWRRKSWSQHLIVPPLRQILAIAALGAGFGLFTFTAYHFAGSFILEKQHALTAMEIRGFKPWMLLPLSVYFVTINPVVEELFWRGVVLNDLTEGDHKILTWPYVWTNVSFAAWHLLLVRLFVNPWLVPGAVMIVASVGFLLSWLYRRTGSVILPMLWHGLVFDLAVVVLLWLIVKG